MRLLSVYFTKTYIRVNFLSVIKMLKNLIIRNKFWFSAIIKQKLLHLYRFKIELSIK